MRSSSYGSVRAIIPLLEYLESNGLDVKILLEHAGISNAVLEEPRTRLPKEHLESLWQLASEATNDPAIALRVSSTLKANSFGIIGQLAAACESGRSAVEVVRGLTPLLWEDVEVELESDRDGAFVRCRAGNTGQISLFTMEYAIGITVTMSRLLWGERAKPLEARFSHARPAYAAAYEQLLHVPVRFDAGEDGVLFPPSLVDGLNPSADKALLKILEHYAADLLAQIPKGAQFSERVRACVAAMLPLCSPGADGVAEQLGISPRTLRRRLAQEHTSYQRIVDQVRNERALRYLVDEKRSIDEVAFLLGFSDHSAFIKAFRRWTGKTPSDFMRDTLDA